MPFLIYAISDDIPANNAWKKTFLEKGPEIFARDNLVTEYERRIAKWTSQLLLKDGLRASYALRGAKGTPEMEPFNGRFKTEGHPLFLEALTIGELIAVVEGRMCYYNTSRRSPKASAPRKLHGGSWSNPGTVGA